MYESEAIEFKEIVSEDICKEVIAFANTNGGTIYVGINNDGREVGLLNVDESYTRLSNLVRDTILPDVTIFIQYELLDGNIIKIKVSEGSAKPYYLKHKGMKPAGVYMRQGTSSVQASWDQIRFLIKNADGDTFESTRSIQQDLSFSTAEIEFKRRNIDFTSEKFVSLGLWCADLKLFTNLAVLISEQCMHSIKVAVFADRANTIFIDRREFGGSIFKHMHDAYDYLMLNNKTVSEIHGLDRYDLQDYPPEAIREALLNAIIHRDYSYSGSIIININPDHLEIINLGGLLPGLSTRDILSGISQPRNSKLAQIFFRLKHIEAYGTGIRRIFDLYRDETIKPDIAVSENTFRMTLPNRNANRQDLGPALVVKDQILTHEDAKRLPMNNLTPQMELIMDQLKIKEALSEEDVMALLRLKRTRTYLILKKMNDLGLIEIRGRGQSKVYMLRSKDR